MPSVENCSTGVKAEKLDLINIVNGQYINTMYSLLLQVQNSIKKMRSAKQKIKRNKNSIGRQNRATSLNYKMQGKKRL